jgi:hypothetical protein
MNPLALLAHFCRRLDRDHRMPARRQRRRIPTGTRSDVQHAARRYGNEMQNIPVRILEGYTFVLFREAMCVLAVDIREAHEENLISASGPTA